MRKIIITLLIGLAINLPSKVNAQENNTESIPMAQYVELLNQYPGMILNGSVDQTTYRIINQFLLNQLNSYYITWQGNTTIIDGLNILSNYYTETLELYHARNSLITPEMQAPKAEKIYAKYVSKKVLDSMSRILLLNS